ncbi:tryptophanase [Salinibacter ruber]|uniref:Tryptophanase n=2 Tax=Salinibacter ruber TaxID=146919 RepID=A0A9X2ZR47_9BACT|nr:tryptophanase [Salinibacter ruber]MCS3655986.1 tryptophanase [Salinibacter ruber]MCS3696590.1 tryptophanase [Salinibacter ruber]MCS3860329.1 tryptophanase [Salinibacter ruber]MCS3950752.1 tryptophanase [Salinibacter ruber]MCS4033758.1 tryptophanase [Salinibacter ruber]
MEMDTIIEPFRIKSVEPIQLTSRAERERMIRDAHYNLFNLHADDVIIDLLTDSGTSAMSAAQWAGLMQGDESYAGSPSYFRFEEAVKDLMPFEHVIPTHQGRAAERILMGIVAGPDAKIPSNTHFDTTRANIEATGAEAVDLVIDAGHVPDAEHPFKGNINLDRLEALLDAEGDRVPIVMLTVTNNTGGGQPVSLANIRGAKALCDAHDVPLVLDACRFAENAYFIKQREDGYGDRSVKEIVREMFSHADGMTMSAKKDALVNIGGWLALDDDAWARKARNQLILTEGFPTYGGLAGRDLEAIAVGLQEIVDEDYLEYRMASTRYLGEALTELGVPIVKPVGGHAVYIDAKSLLPHIPPLDYPAQSLAVALYVTGGIRGVEIGSVMFGRQPDGSEEPADQELLRLAIPRRVYTQSHVDYVIECFEALVGRKGALCGYEITEEPPQLRHFTAHLRPKAPEAVHHETDGPVEASS